MQIRKITVQICGNFWVTQYHDSGRQSMNEQYQMRSPENIKYFAQIPIKELGKHAFHVEISWKVSFHSSLNIISMECLIAAKKIDFFIMHFARNINLYKKNLLTFLLYYFWLVTQICLNNFWNCAYILLNVQEVFPFSSRYIQKNKTSWTCCRIEFVDFTACPRRLDHICIVSRYIKKNKTSWLCSRNEE